MSCLWGSLLLGVVLHGAAIAAQGTAPCAIATRSERIGTGTIVYNIVGAGPDVLLLHGLFASKEQWDALACRLAERGFTAIAPDLPGYGKSDGFPLSDYRLENQADKLHALMTRLSIECVDLAGNSMGGAIASLYTTRHPQQVRSLAFIGSPHGIIGWSEGVLTAIYHGINPFIPVSKPQLDLELRLLFVSPPVLPQSKKNDLVAGYIRHNRHYVQVWNIVNLYNDVLVQRPSPRAPTLIVWGDDDRIFSVAGAQKLHRRIPGSEVRRLPHAGHLLHIENAADVAPIYVDFLKNVAKSSAGVVLTPRNATSANGADVKGLAKPASQNCVERGGRLTIEKSPNGAQFGVCNFPDNLQCEEWVMMCGDCRVGGISPDFECARRSWRRGARGAFFSDEMPTKLVKTGLVNATKFSHRSPKIDDKTGGLVPKRGLIYDCPFSSSSC